MRMPSSSVLGERTLSLISAGKETLQSASLMPTGLPYVIEANLELCQLHCQKMKQKVKGLKHLSHV